MELSPTGTAQNALGRVVQIRGGCWVPSAHRFVASTIATMPARTGSGSAGHAATIVAKSGSSGVSGSLLVPYLVREGFAGSVSGYDCGPPLFFLRPFRPSTNLTAGPAACGQAGSVSRLCFDCVNMCRILGGKLAGCRATDGPDGPYPTYARADHTCARQVVSLGSPEERRGWAIAKSVVRADASSARLMMSFSEVVPL